MQNSTRLFDQFNDINVLIVGDVMLDRYMTGAINRISPEAPVPVVLHQSTENRLGGAANVALNIRAMGATSHLISVIGKDENAAIFLDLLPENDLLAEGIIQSASRKTTVKTRVLAQNQQILRVDREDTHGLSASEGADLLQKIKETIKSKAIDVILFQDYNKGVLSKQMIAEVIQIAQLEAIPTVVDPKLNNFLEYKGVTLFKPNLKEVREGLKMQIEDNLEGLSEAAQRLKQELKHKYTMITLSEKGIFISDGTQNQIIPTIPRNIADVCGAGDTVVSLAALGMALSLSIQEIGMLANLAGGQVCERVGVVPVSKSKLYEEYIDYLSRNQIK